MQVQMQINRWRLPAIAIFAVFTMLAGCTTIEPRIYLLGYPSDITPVARDETGMPIIEVEPVSVPDFQDSRDIFVRKGANELVADPAARWGERLSVGMTRALSAALAKRKPEFRVTSSKPAVIIAQKVRVDVDTFEIRADGLCLLGARWTITGQGGRQTATTDYARFVVNAAGVDTASVVGAMTQAVDQLADRISLALSDR
ncbi:MAG: PqiC family protein [Rhodospirillales bacterium]|nr:PqiC family protein [Rhodospirillales bacterium]